MDNPGHPHKENRPDLFFPLAAKGIPPLTPGTPPRHFPSPRSFVRRGTLLILLLGILGVPGLARAELGAPFSPQEAQKLGYPQISTAPLPGGLTAYTMSRQSTNLLGHTVTERIREIAGSDGLVFALSWSTLHPPDLRQLLGGRLPASLPFVRGERILSLPNLELRMGGSVLHAEGAAWDPRQLPPGANLKSLLALP